AFRFDPEVAPAERVPSRRPGALDSRPAGEPEAPSEVALLGGHGGEQIGTLLDLDQALAALALLETGGRDGDPYLLGTLEQGLAEVRRGGDAVDNDRPGRGAGGRAHDAAAPPAPGAAAPAAACSAITRWKSSTALRAPAPQPAAPMSVAYCSETGAPPMQIFTSWSPASLNFCTTVRM